MCLFFFHVRGHCRPQSLVCSVRFSSAIFRDPGYWWLSPLYSVASIIILRVHILPADVEAMWKVKDFYGPGQEVAHTSSTQIPVDVAM